MTVKERISQLEGWGYFISNGNDAIGIGYVCFKSDIHSLVPSPISFIFIRELSNGEYKEIAFSMPQHSWKSIVIEAMKDLL